MERDKRDFKNLLQLHELVNQLGKIDLPLCKPATTNFEST